MTCQTCGAPEGLRVEHEGEALTICPACMDQKWPSLRLGALSRAFQRPLVRNGACPHCGCTEEEATASGLVGCPLCYEALGERVWEELGLEVRAK